MTLGTFLLSWVYDLTPTPTSATTLRSVQPSVDWQRIVVQTVPPTGLRSDGAVRGFHHMFIDGEGAVHVSQAWRDEQPDPHAFGTIRVAVAVERPDAALSPRQWQRLADLVGGLQKKYGIPHDHVRVADGQTSDQQSRRGRDQLHAMLRTR
jgi:hypothetical protein